jgi:PEGA domain
MNHAARRRERTRNLGHLVRGCAGRLALAAALAATLPAAPAAAQGAASGPSSKAAREEAASRFRKGLDLFKDGDARAALAEFRRAHELVPSYAVLYNIGQVQYELQDYAGALSTLERYLAEGGRQISTSRRAEVEKDIQKLKTRIAQIDLSLNVPDAEIAIDDVSHGKGPFTKPFTVSAGRHRISATRDGYFPVTRVIDIASNDTVKLTLDLVERTVAQPAPGPESTAAPDAPERPPQSRARVDEEPPGAPSRRDRKEESGPGIPWAGWALTGAFAAGAATFGVLALRGASDLEDKRNRFGVSPDDLDHASTRTSVFAVSADALTGAAVIAGGVTLFLTFRGASSAREAPATSRAPVVRVGLSPAGLALSGAF